MYEEHQSIETETRGGCCLHRLLGFWSSIKVCLKSAYRAQPKVRIDRQTYSWMSKHGWMIWALWAVRNALEVGPIPLPKYACVRQECTFWVWALYYWCCLRREIDLLRRRSLISLNFLTHSEECALYFRLRGRPLNKPDYVFKMFDKIHSMVWPNE